MYGQYSAHAQPRRGKGVMIAQVAECHGFTPDKKTARQIARNTLDYTAPDGTRRVRLHDTDVVTFAPNGTITLDTGGWQTVTSKDRMNLVLPDGWSVYAHRGWFVRTPAGDFSYADGVKFKPDGTPANPARIAAEEKRVKRDKALTAAFIKHAKAEGWGDPAGDPWCFSPDVGRETMIDWLRSKYFTARMMMLALQHAGFSEMGVSMYMSDMARAGNKPSTYMAGKLRKYIYSQLGGIA